MKKIFSLAVIPLLALLLVGITLPNRTEAAEFSFKDGYTLAAGESVNDDLYLFSENTKIEGTINGDLVSFGKSLQLQGNVTGNVYVFGQNILLGSNSQIQGDLYIFAYKAQVNGSVYSNATLFASSVLHSGSTGKDLTVFTADSILSGNTGDDLRVFSSRSAVKGNVAGDALMFAETYDLDSTKVSGKVYDSEAVKQIAKGQGVDLEEENKDWISKDLTLGIRINNVLIGFVSMLIAGAFLIFMTPVKTGLVVKKISTSSSELLKSFGVGIAVIFLAWVPIFFLLVSVVGIPLAGVLIAFLIFTAIFGSVWVELAIGREVLRLFKVDDYRPFKSFLIGRGVSTIVNLIPIIGGMYSFIVMSVALGAFVRVKKDLFDKQNTAITKKK